MNDATNDGLQVAATMLDDNTVARLRSAIGATGFGARLGEMALEYAFDGVWKRPGMAAKDRSLVTLGILIALRQSEELKIHIGAALCNGCTVQDIEETIYQCAIYAGFPAASAALGGAMNVLREAGHLK
jgi:4-carboxymuconolactone decarboxylase